MELKVFNLKSFNNIIVLVSNKNTDFLDYGRAVFKKDNLNNFEFLFLLYSIIFINLNKLSFKQFITENDLENILNNINIDTLYDFENVSFNLTVDTETNRCIFYDIAIETIYKNFDIKKNKQFFEISKWLYQFFEFIIRLHLLLCNLENIILDNDDKKEKYDMVIYNKKKDYIENIIKDIINTENKTNIIYHIIVFKYHSIRLDFVSQGTQLVSILSNDMELMKHSNLKKKNNINEPESYDRILDILKDNYNKSKNYLFINQWLHYFIDHPETQIFFKEAILSRETVKDKTMLEAYGGTLYGFKEKFKKRILDLANYNLILLPGTDTNFYSDFDKMASNMGKELNKIMLEKFPGIKNDFIIPINNFVKSINMEKENGIKIITSHISFILAPELNMTFVHTMKKYSKKDKVLEREGVRSLTYFTGLINKPKVTTSLSANIIQSLDSLILYYFNETIRLLSPNIKTTALHDAIIFGNDFADSTRTSSLAIKDLIRLSVYLAFKTHIFNSIIINNKFDLNKENSYKPTYTTIFSKIETRAFEVLYSSKLLNYLLTHQHSWNPKNLNFFYNAFEIYATDREKTYAFSKIRLQLQDKLSHEDLNLIFSDSLKVPRLLQIKKLHISLYLGNWISFVVENFIENMSLSIPTSLLNELHKIMNNDDFMKF